MIIDRNKVIDKALERVINQAKDLEAKIGYKEADKVKESKEEPPTVGKTKKYTAVLKIASVIMCMLLASIMYSFVFMPNIIKSIPAILRGIDPIAIIKGGSAKDQNDFTNFKYTYK